MLKAGDVSGRWWRNVVFFLIALLVIAADQFSKAWIRSYPRGQPIFEVGFFRLTHVQNTGAAFGLFQSHSFALTIVALVGIIALLVYVLFIYRHSHRLDNVQNRITLGLILGGTLGNLIDRRCFGGVTDFICVGTWWPAFNIADSAITVGVIILVYSLLRLAQVEKH